MRYITCALLIISGAFYEETEYSATLINGQWIDLSRGKVGCFSKWFCLGSKSGYQASDKNDPKNRRALALSRSLSLREQTEGGKVPYQEGTWISRTIRLKYAPFLMRLETKLIVLFVYIAYLAAAIYGCVTTRQGLEPMRLLVHDSYAIKYYVRLEQYFWHVGTQAQLVFSNPGDLSDPANRRRIVQIVNQFANSSHGKFLMMTTPPHPILMPSRVSDSQQIPDCIAACFN